VPDLRVRTSAFCEFKMVDGAKALLGQRWKRLKWQGVASYAEVLGSLFLCRVNESVMVPVRST